MNCRARIQNTSFRLFLFLLPSLGFSITTYDVCPPRVLRCQVSWESSVPPRYLTNLDKTFGKTKLVTPSSVLPPHKLGPTYSSLPQKRIKERFCSCFCPIEKNSMWRILLVRNHCSSLNIQMTLPPSENTPCALCHLCSQILTCKEKT